MTRLLGHMTGPDAPDGSLDMLLEIGDNVMTHRRRYNVSTARLTVTDLLALDPLNPRSILFQLNESASRSSNCRTPWSTARCRASSARPCACIRVSPS